jgi:hypothetical protein
VSCSELLSEKTAAGSAAPSIWAFSVSETSIFSIDERKIKRTKLNASGVPPIRRFPHHFSCETFEFRVWTLELL